VNRLLKLKSLFMRSLETENLSKTRFRAHAWLLIMTVIWGTSFPLVKTALGYASPALFLALRFWLATILLFPYFIILSQGKISLDLWKRGALLGVSLFGGLILQTKGLSITTASKSGFLTGLTVVFVPLLVITIERKKPGLRSWIAVALCVAGIFLMTSPSGAGWNTGDWLTLLCAVVFAFEIVLIEMFSRKGEAFLMTFLMVFVTAVLATFWARFGEHAYLRISAPLAMNLLLVTVFSTVLGFWIQTSQQPKTSATVAAVIYTLEPVFAACFAMIWLGERMNLTAWVGAGLILIGLLIAAWKR
jgi:drug/metabolite transporter (DMT)-like permease